MKGDTLVSPFQISIAPECQRTHFFKTSPLPYSLDYRWLFLFYPFVSTIVVFFERGNISTFIYAILEKYYRLLHVTNKNAISMFLRQIIFLFYPKIQVELTSQSILRLCHEKFGRSRLITGFEFMWDIRLKQLECCNW